jgi:hypothetical protein
MTTALYPLFSRAKGLALPVLAAVAVLFFADWQTLAAKGWNTALPAGIWTKVHQMKPEDPVVFHLQSHGGSAFDIRRGRVVLFGSDSHGLDWSNAPLIFDIASLHWRRVYPDDPPSSYRVNAQGLPVAGPRGTHPWAMHSFGAVDYDTRRDAVVVSSHPEHMEPGRFSDALAGIWPQVRWHPTWIFDLQSEQWSPLPASPSPASPSNDPDTLFFAYSTAYDSDRGRMIGAGYHGVFELTGDPLHWQKKADGEAIGYHSNTVYDPRHKALVIFGRNGLGNDVLIYRPGSQVVTAMPTPGVRPPRDEHAPMAYHPGLGETIVLIDRFEPGMSRENRSDARAETWAYTLGDDRWRRVGSATLPYGLGMNYHLHYDPARDLLLLVTATPPVTPGGAAGLPEVWALRL